MDKSPVPLKRKFIILGLFVTATVFLAPRASAASFVHL